MQLHRPVIVICAVALLAACGSSPAEKQKIAEARYTEEKTKTLKEYKECVLKAKDDAQKLDTCERLLKAVDATNPAPAPQ